MFAFLSSCQMSKTEIFDIQGHRGCRGILPENTLVAFEKAFQLGVTTLEMDVVITKDKKVLVSHEPYFSSEISTLPNGEFISPENEKNYNIYQLAYLETQSIDCGLKKHPRFPDQEKLKATKPLLEEVFKSIELLSAANQRTIFYNIETKSTPEGDNLYHPEPKEFAQLLYNVIKKSDQLNNTIIQSFDVRTLQEFKKLNPQLPLALLVENELTPKENIQLLGFAPDVYSPGFKLVDEELVSYCHSENIKLIPWTVNKIEHFERLKSLHVDGIITDYPNLFCKPNK
jgi:glycerophosphoryl diester phosphodiesterase